MRSGSLSSAVVPSPQSTFLAPEERRRITLGIRQDGVRQAVAHGESPAKFTLICSPAVFKTPSRSTHVEACLQIGKRYSSLSNSRLDRDTAVITSPRRLGSEAAITGQVDIREIVETRGQGEGP